jgi:hypothetical protein
MLGISKKKVILKTGLIKIRKDLIRSGGVPQSGFLTDPLPEKE